MMSEEQNVSHGYRNDDRIILSNSIQETCYDRRGIVEYAVVDSAFSTSVAEEKLCFAGKGTDLKENCNLENKLISVRKSVQSAQNTQNI